MLKIQLLQSLVSFIGLATMYEELISEKSNLYDTTSGKMGID